MSTEENHICYFIFDVTARHEGIVEAMVDDIHAIKNSTEIEVEKYEMNEEKPKQLRVVGGAENLAAGLYSLQEVFGGMWRREIDSGIFYYVSPYDGNYGIIHTTRELTFTNSINVEDVKTYFYQYKCRQLFECIDSVLQTMGIENLPICLAVAIYEYIYVEAAHCFWRSKYSAEKDEVCLSYAKTHNKQQFTDEHAKLIRWSDCYERKNKAYGRKFGESRLIW